MSRFSFAFIATVFACLSMVSCEKEEFQPNTIEATSKIAAEGVVANMPTIFTTPADEYAIELLAELGATPTLTAAGTKFTVTSQMPVEKNLRYLDMLPDASQEVASLNIDCPYGDCETTVPAMVAKYQEIATAQCNDQFLCITCCADGKTTYIVVYIEADCIPARYQ